MIKGLNSLMNLLSEDGIRKAASQPLKTYINSVVQDARNEAPTSITYVHKEGYLVEPTNVKNTISGGVQNGDAYIEVADPLAPYIEFGTGKFAADLLGTYSEEWRDVAFYYFVDGTGTLMANPFLHDAIEDNIVILDKELENKFK